MAGTGDHRSDPVRRIMASTSTRVVRTLRYTKELGPTTPTTARTRRRSGTAASSIRGTDFASSHQLQAAVTWSTIAFGPGPIPRHVTYRRELREAASSRAGREAHRSGLRPEGVEVRQRPSFTTTFFWPSAHHSANHFRWRTLASKAAMTEAWATWTANLPRDSSSPSVPR